MPRTTTTGLLRSQASRQRAIWDNEDRIVDFEWQSSDKSAEALNYYVSHFTDRQSNPTVDASRQLTYANKIRSANRAFTSNEIQRATIAVLEGAGTDEQKLGVMTELYKRAYENEDYDLAQNLRQQIDNQIIKIQNAQVAAASGGGYGGGGGGGAASEYTTSVKKFAQDIKNGDIEAVPGLTVSQIASDIKNFGNQAALDMIYAHMSPEQIAGLGGATTPLQVIYSTIAQNYAALRDAAGAIEDPYDRAQVLSDINRQVASETVDIGGKKLSLAMLEKIATDEANGNPSMKLIQGVDGFQWQGNPVTDYEWQFDAAGQPVQVQKTYSDVNANNLEAGYTDPNKQIAYQVDKNGLLVVAQENKAYGKDGKLKAGFLTRDDLISQAGFVKKDGVWVPADASTVERLRQAGVQDISGLTDEAFVVGKGGTVEFMAGNKLFEVFKNDLENTARIREVVGQSAQDFIRQGAVAPSTTTLLGEAQMKRDLQANLSGAALQGANTASLVQPAGGAGQILQRAANAQQIMQARVENLRVQQLPVAQPIAVAPLPAPTPIRVTDTRYQVPLKVASAPAQTIAVRPTAPTSPAVVVPQPKLQATGQVQQAGGNLFQGGFSGNLRVR